MSGNREALEAASEKIWNYTVTELGLALPFLRGAFFLLSPQLDLRIQNIGTDGSTVAYQPRYLMQVFLEAPWSLRRTCFHLFLHCIFRHVYHVPEEARAREDWDIAADIAVEYLADSLDEDILRETESDPRRAWYERFLAESRIMTAERIYRSLQGMDLSFDEREELRETFWRCDHSLWKNPETKPPKTEEKSLPSEEKRWEDAAEHVEKMMIAAGREAGRGRESFLRALHIEGEARLSYGELLRRFAVSKEVMEIDPDAFDYAFYNYGMEHYGNMPLIEENEYREERRIAALVIAIDSSASTQHGDVEQFFAETLGIFREEQAFFRDAEIHVIQCDEAVREDRRCRSLGELEAAREHLRIAGGGGTDFRPVFRYVEDLQAKGELTELRGLFYFTDGEGAFPREASPYQTVFVFPARDESVEGRVPAWALKAYLEEKKA